MIGKKQIGRMRFRKLCAAVLCITMCMAMLVSGYAPEIYSQTVQAAVKEPVWNKNSILVNGKDSESIVFLVLGDGFTAGEQDLFHAKAKELTDYLLNVPPFSEYKNRTNIYSLDVISKESGAADNPNNLKDTYFKCSYNYAYQIERLLAASRGDKAIALAKQYVPDYDAILLIVNDERYGGSGGRFAVTSINQHSYEILVHELGHTIGSLADEYWAGDEYAGEAPNRTQKADPSKVPWKELLNIKDTGIYPYEEDSSWYRPSQNCKMRFLGVEYPFCAVCTKVLQDRLQDLQWQTSQVYSYQSLLNLIRVTPAKKTVTLKSTNKQASVQLRTKVPEQLHIVKSFTSQTVHTNHFEVKITYRSKNPRIAAVSTSGKVVAKKAGKTSIMVMASLADGTKNIIQIPLEVQAKSK